MRCVNLRDTFCIYRTSLSSSSLSWDPVELGSLPVQGQTLFAQQKAEQSRKEERGGKAERIKQRLMRLEVANDQLRTDLSELERRVQHRREGREEVRKVHNRLFRMMKWSNTVLHAGKPLTVLEHRRFCPCAELQLHQIQHRLTALFFFWNACCVDVQLYQC